MAKMAVILEVMPPMHEVANIVLLLLLSKASGRDILGGLSAYVRKTRCRWRLHVVNSDLTRAGDDLSRVLEIGADGVVAHGVTDATTGPLANFAGPIVWVGMSGEMLPGRIGPLTYVNGDEEAIADVGARYLESLGRFRSFGFLSRVPESKRGPAFRAHFAERGLDARIHVWDDPKDGGGTRRERLERWLRGLPRPAAVMAENDQLALDVLEAASRAGLRVPRDLAVLGVDNDELLCETAEPTLASVVVDHVRLGELAAEAMRRLLADPDQPSFTLLAPVRGVVERQSARPVAPAAALAERAATFIRRNATRGISSSDVAAHLGVSRSLADLRFRQTMGESMLEMILRLRLEAVKRKLRDTAMPIGQVTASCGFACPEHAKRLFKARFGCSMRDWRQRTISQ